MIYRLGGSLVIDSGTPCADTVTVMAYLDDLRDKAHSCALAEERVREIHLKVTNARGEAWCDYCSNGEGYAYDWPCPTIRALEGEEVTDANHR